METSKYCKFCKKHTFTQRNQVIGGKGELIWQTQKKKKHVPALAGLKTEFSKIIWPDGSSVGKQTVAVVATSVVVAFIIVILDYVIQYGVDFLVKL